MKCPFLRVLWYWLPPIIWPVIFRIAVLLLLSGRPPTWAASNDKLMHLLYFGTMALLFWRAFRFERQLAPWPAAFAAFGVIALFGGIDEFTQQFRPSRSADIKDWFADMAGGALMFVIAYAETTTQHRRDDVLPVPCPET